MFADIEKAAADLALRMNEYEYLQYKARALDFPIDFYHGSVHDN